MRSTILATAAAFTALSLGATYPARALTAAEETALGKQFTQDIADYGKASVSDCWLKAASGSQTYPLSMLLQLYRICLIGKR